MREKKNTIDRMNAKCLLDYKFREVYSSPQLLRTN